MTALPAEVFFDTWAWWEIIANTLRGKRLHAKYMGAPNSKVHTSTLCLAEVVGKFVEVGQPQRGTKAVALIEAHARVHDLRRDAAVRAPLIRAELRKLQGGAGMLDAMILATAREVGVPLISGDPAFANQEDVRDH